MVVTIEAWPINSLIFPIHLRRATGLCVFGLLDYRGRRHGRLHSPRTKRMTEKSAVTQSAMIVQTKKKAPLDLAESIKRDRRWRNYWAL